MLRHLPFSAVLALSIIVGVIALAQGEASRFSSFVDPTGQIVLPDPNMVRLRWQHLGTWAVKGEQGVDEFHTVYTQPGTADAFRRSGEFPDGSVLVKEVRKASQGSMTTGEVAWSGGEVLWFVMVRDAKGRFPGNPLWANRWGWALFLAKDRGTNAATDFRDDCMGCHLPARKNDWVFTEGYPILRN